MGSRCTGVSGANRSHLAAATMMAAKADGLEAVDADLEGADRHLVSPFPSRRPAKSAPGCGINHSIPSRGKITEAHDLLAPVYGWVTEGFDTADLKETNALLMELT